MERIGFANEFYTLWSVMIDDKYFLDGYGKYWLIERSMRYSYIKNISKSLDKVKELYPGVEIDEELKGYRLQREFSINEKFQPVEILWFGKHYGKRIEDLIKEDFNYTLWLHANCSQAIKEYIESLDEFKKYQAEKDKEEKKTMASVPDIKPGDVFKVMFDRNPKEWDDETVFIIGEHQSTGKEKPLNVWIEFKKFTKKGSGKYSFFVVIIDGVEHKLKNKEFEFVAKDVSERWIDGYENICQKITI